MKHVMAKFVPQLLLPKQGKPHAALANDLIQTATNEPDFLKKVITGGESWVYGYDPEMKARSSQWKQPGSPCPKNVQQSHSKNKSMLIVFFDWKSVVHHKYTPPGHTINKEYYLNVIRWLRNAQMYVCIMIINVYMYIYIYIYRYQYIHTNIHIQI